MKVLDTFNSTLNGVLSKLKQTTVNTSASVDSEVPKARSITKNAQEGRIFQILQSPKTIVMNILDDQVMNSRIRGPTEPRNFFQNLGRNIDKLIFPRTPAKLDNINEHSAAVVEDTANENERTEAQTEHSEPKKEERPEPKEEPPESKPDQSQPNAQHSFPKISTSNAIMFSSIL